MLYNRSSVPHLLTVSVQRFFRAPLLLPDSRTATLEPSPVTPPPYTLHYLPSTEEPGPDLLEGEQGGPATDRRG